MLALPDTLAMTALAGSSCFKVIINQYLEENNSNLHMMTTFNLQNGSIKQALEVNSSPFFDSSIRSSGIQNSTSHLVLQIMVEEVVIDFKGDVVSSLLLQRNNTKEVLLLILLR